MNRNTLLIVALLIGVIFSLTATFWILTSKSTNLSPIFQRQTLQNLLPSIFGKKPYQEFPIPRLAPLENAKPGSIISVQKYGVTLSLPSGEKKSYEFTAPTAYLMLQNKPGIKLAPSDLRSGQMVDFATVVDSNGIEKIQFLIVKK